MLDNQGPTVLRTYDPLNACHRNCENIHSWYDSAGRSICKVVCNNMFKAPEKSDDQSTQYGKTRVHLNESNLNDLDSGMNTLQLRGSLGDWYMKQDSEVSNSYNSMDVIGAILGARSPSDSSEATILQGAVSCTFSCMGQFGLLDMKCYNKCMSQSSEALPSYSSKPTFSERLTSIANNLHNEAEELSTISGDLVYF